MRDLSEFQGLIPDLGDGEDEILTVIQIKRPKGVDGPLLPEMQETWNAFYGALCDSVGEENLVVVSSQTATETESSGPVVVTREDFDPSAG